MKKILSTFAAALLVLGTTAARAQVGPTPPAQNDLGQTSSDRPWAHNVTPDEQRLASELFREANGLLKESLFVQAAAKYREALAHWNHPGIHYNLALALLNLDQPVEVFTQLEEAIKYGPAPLDADKFEHAGRYKALIEKQLARIEVSAAEPGAAVSLDGRTLFTAPGRYDALVRAGQHTVVATKTGFVATQKTPTLPAGLKTTLDLRLYTAEELTHYRRRWSLAMPYTVLAVGIAIAGAGGIMQWQSAERFKSYDNGVTRCSSGSMSGGCTPSGSLSDQKSQGQSLQAAAIAGYAIGGAAAVTGAFLLYLNRARPYRVSPEGSDKLTVAPYLGPQGGGVVALLRY